MLGFREKFQCGKGGNGQSEECHEARSERAGSLITENLTLSEQFDIRTTKKISVVEACWLFSAFMSGVLISVRWMILVLCIAYVCVKRARHFLLIVGSEKRITAILHNLFACFVGEKCSDGDVHLYCNVQVHDVACLPISRTAD